MTDELCLRAFGPQDLLVPAIARLNDAEVPRVSPLGELGLRRHLQWCDLAVLAEDGAGRLAGFVLAVAPGSDYASMNYRWFEDRGTDHLYVDRVVVGPDHRRRGLAGRLYDAVEARARAAGRAEVTCEVNVDPPNDVSWAFHAVRGFVEVGRQRTTGGTIEVALLARPLPDLSGDRFAGRRQEYTRASLDATDLDRDPLVEVRRWVDDAGAAGLAEPTAVTLATVDETGLPDARIVLLRGIDARGVHFYTNTASAKGRQLASNPRAAVVAHWQPLERQVRLRGRVEPLPDDESDAYFASRPRDTRIGAWASDQSAPVDDRRSLEQRVAEAAARFEDREVPRPPHWGGYVLRPSSVEFWQGRPARLHDRIRYERDGDDGDWSVRRLQP